MFDIGGWEFLIIIVVAIVVIGPKDLPGAIRSVTGWIRKARELAREFQSGIDDLAQEVDLEKITDEVKEGVGLGDPGDVGNTIHDQISNTLDPSGEVADAFDEANKILDNDFPESKDELDSSSDLTDSRDGVTEPTVTKNKNPANQEDQKEG
ncbi:MAG: twin-arginine translocase subunit TatB [Rhodospirillaceae bacterium]|nr:twin-arginine translocase subunit TatB [Rhodospirillaceae bacterium]|tara:strand:+ start:27344 stop:27799 length:456 start_codon:yes stop_codon:yes gene_type:complete